MAQKSPGRKSRKSAAKSLRYALIPTYMIAYPHGFELKGCIALSCTIVPHFDAAP
jgi:hypothetical protein